MRKIHFVVAIAIGWLLADSNFSLPRAAFWTVAASGFLTLITLVVQHWTLPPASRSRRGLTIFQGQLGWLFFGTIITIAVTALVLVFIRQRFG